MGCRCISASLASQTISHALTGHVSKYMYLTSYSRLLIPPLLYVAHTLHTSTNSPPLSRGKRTGPADGLRPGVHSRVGTGPEGTNISLQRFDRFRPNMARRSSSIPLSRLTVKNVKFRKFKMAAAAVLGNRTRRPASADRTAHAANNYRRDLEAT